MHSNIQWLTLSENQPKRTLAIYALLAWMIINVVFMGLEVTVFNDAADLNNSILLILWVLSTAGLLLMRKLGAALTTFTLIYAFSFNAFNVIYFPQVIVLNGTSAIINAVATIYMFITIFKNKYK
jgi:hypothetical protein